MRIIKFLISALLVIGIFGGIAFLVWREYMLVVGTSQMRSTLRQVATISRNSGVYATECREKGIIELDESAIQSIQLRFTSAKDYQIEVICNQFALDPIVVNRETLPPFVEKLPGYSGILWGERRSGLAISMFGRTRAVYVENNQAFTGTLSDIEGSIGPVTTCSGNGYSCCQTETSIGQGQQITNVTDCTGRCFATCTPRPVVLSLSTQPFYDLRTRVLNVSRGEEVTVAYVIDPADSEFLEVTIDYGDGTSEQLTGEFSGSATHTYSCPTSNCRYELQISVINEDGISAAQTPVTRATVFVQ